VVLKREPLGSLLDKFLIHGRRFVPGRNWGENQWMKKIEMFNICLFNTSKNYTTRLV